MEMTKSNTETLMNPPPPERIHSVCEIKNRIADIILPPAPPETTKTIVLDLDNTLINATFTAHPPPPHYDFTILIQDLQERPALCYVQKRPALDNLFAELAKNKYEIIIFTAARKAYADRVLNKLDVHNAIKHRVYRDSCTKTRGLLFKDLARLGRDLKNVIIVDDVPRNYKMQPQNAFAVKPFFGDLSDRELRRVADFCNAAAKCEDVREAIAMHNAIAKNVDAELDRLRERERKRDGESWAGFFRPNKKSKTARTKTIVLGLFNVLIKASLEPLPRNDFMISMVGSHSSEMLPHYVMKRPGLDNFLSKLARNYEIVVFADAPKKAADVFLDKLDVNMDIKRRLYRGSSWIGGRDHVKNLDSGTLKSVLNVDLKDVIVVDHDGVSYNLERDNWVVVKKFGGDLNDGELYEVMEFCKVAALYDDVREFRKEVPSRLENESRPQKQSRACTIQ